MYEASLAQDQPKYEIYWSAISSYSELRLSTLHFLIGVKLERCLSKNLSWLIAALTWWVAWLLWSLRNSYLDNKLLPSAAKNWTFLVPVSICSCLIYTTSGFYMDIWTGSVSADLYCSHLSYFPWGRKWWQSNMVTSDLTRDAYGPITPLLMKHAKVAACRLSLFDLLNQTDCHAVTTQHERKLNVLCSVWL